MNSDSSLDSEQELEVEDEEEDLSLVQKAVKGMRSALTTYFDTPGKLSQNRMLVSHMWFDERVVETDFSADQSSATYSHSDPTWVYLARVAMLCNNAEFKARQEGVPVIRSGPAYDSAILKIAELSIGNTEEFRRRNKRICEIPFTSTNKYQVCVHETEDASDPRYLLVMKGAPEVILDRCSTVCRKGKDEPIDEPFRQAVNAAYQKQAGLGERVLGFCDCHLPSDQYPPGCTFDPHKPNFQLTGLRFLGLIAMIDPPRSGVCDSIRQCRSAGIKLSMFTGEHPITSKMIAYGVGILSEGSKTVEDIASDRGIPVDEVNPSEAKAAVIHGSTLRDMTSSQLDVILKSHEEIVFARTTTDQKSVIVEGYQRLGATIVTSSDLFADSNVCKQGVDVILLED